MQNAAMSYELYEPTVPEVVDPGGTELLLDVWLASRRPGFHENLETALKIAMEVLKLHRTGKVIRAIYPTSIAICSLSSTIRIVGSDLQKKEMFLSESPVMDDRFIRCVLPYLAPENTGRIKTDSDVRSVYYSLGAIYYEMFSGEVPFAADDPLEIVHGHIARSPVSLSKKIKSLPGMISQIVLKLLAKNPGDRYQNILALVSDLKKCCKSYERYGTIPYFSIGMEDVPEQLSFSEKLYGRDTYYNKLMSVFKRIRKGGAECVFISGESGMGKTSLIQAFGYAIKQKGAYFASGKYDPIRSRIPYSGITACLQDLVRQILTESPARLEKWEKKIRQAVGPNGKIVSDVIPDIIHIIGEQQETQKLSTVEEGNRFKQVFTNFIKGLAHKEHPLVLFLDDLQWVDPASLDFLKWFFLEGPPEKFLLIGSCRIPVKDEYPFSTRIPENWKSSGMFTTRISLRQLTKPSVDELIGDYLKKTEEKERSFSSEVYEITGGNPFLIKRFIQVLYSENRLWFDYEKGVWAWDSKAFALDDISRSPEELFTENIKKLPKKTQELLCIGSCMGTRFPLVVLGLVSNLMREDILLFLEPALNDKIITPVNSGKLKHQTEKTEAVEFEFLHDRIRQSIYDMVSVENRKRIHLKIGREIFKKTRPELSNKSLFHIVNHLNLGSDFIVSHKEKIEVAGLNLKAATIAKKSTAFDAACLYCRTALKLLPAPCWETTYQETLSLYMVMAESEYLNGNIIEAEKVFKYELSQVKGSVEKARVINLRIVLYTANGRIEEAIEQGIKGLGLFNDKLPENPGKFRVVWEYFRTRLKLVGKTTEELARQPLITDPEKKEIVNLYTNIGVSYYYKGPNCFAYIITRGARLCLEYGFPTSLPPAMIAFGMITGFGFGRYKAGLQLALKGIHLLETMKDTSLSARAYFIFGFFIVGWKEQAGKSIHYMRLARRYGMESGNLIYSGHSINAIFTIQMISGEKLDEIYSEYQSSSGFMKRLNDPFITGNYFDNIRMYKLLKGKFEKADFKYEKKREDQVRRLKNPLALFIYLNTRLRCYFYFGEYEKCLYIAEEMDEFKHVADGTLYLAEYYFFYSLAIAEYLSRRGLDGKKKFVRRLKKIQKKMKYWATMCPENFYHKYLLITAEILRLYGKDSAAMVMYKRAIQSSEKNGYGHNAAIAYKCAAECLLKSGFNVSARSNIEEAIRLVEEWGADALASFYQETYRNVLASKEKARHESIASLVDYTSVAHSLRVISTEMNPKVLLQKILYIAMENAGARRGIYIAVRDTVLYAEAEGVEGTLDAINTIPSPIESRDDLLKESIYYVWRTGRYVVLRDAGKEGDYVASPYVVSSQLKSVLVLPVYRKSDMAGILYLENQIAAGVFTAQRIKTLELIASQSAISVENARLYEEITNKERRLRTLSSELFLTEERERRKIAVGLHDRIGHSLTNALMALPVYDNQAKPDEVSGSIKKVSDIIKGSIRDVQSLTFDLSPPVLYDLGLVAALEWLANKTRLEHALIVELTGGPDVAPEESVSVMIFQIVREMIFNCVKHAQASKVTVFIGLKQGNVKVEVNDDGKGFILSHLDYDTKRGYGLFSARERVKHMGGIFNIKTAPGKGTRITIVLPATMNDQSGNKAEISLSL